MDDNIDLNKVFVQQWAKNDFSEKKVYADILRLDIIHPVISGNKWFKLKYYLQQAKKNDKKGIISFGGAYSNHLIALAYACKLSGLNAIGIVRGEKPSVSSHTLSEAEALGMKMEFISRTSYKLKEEQTFLDELTKKYKGYDIVPEGGAGKPGIKGAAEIVNLLPVNDYTHIICAVGTGTMLKGLSLAALPAQKVIGISVLKGLEQNETDINNTQIINNYHFGGYAKYTQELIDFMNNIYSQSKIPSDFVYTGKLFYAVNDLVQKGYFSPNSKILVIHSGGLQGNRSLSENTLIFY